MIERPDLGQVDLLLSFLVPGGFHCISKAGRDCSIERGHDSPEITPR